MQIAARRVETDIYPSPFIKCPTINLNATIAAAINSTKTPSLTKTFNEENEGLLEKKIEKFDQE